MLISSLRNWSEKFNLQGFQRENDPILQNFQWTVSGWRAFYSSFLDGVIKNPRKNAQIEKWTFSTFPLNDQPNPVLHSFQQTVSGWRAFYCRLWYITSIEVMKSSKRSNFWVKKSTSFCTVFSFWRNLNAWNFPSLQLKWCTKNYSKMLSILKLSVGNCGKLDSFCLSVERKW